eukprot:5963345-Pyramimonas_sp.AAC.1
MVWRGVRGGGAGELAPAWSVHDVGVLGMVRSGIDMEIGLGRRTESGGTKWWHDDGVMGCGGPMNSGTGDEGRTVQMKKTSGTGQDKVARWAWRAGCERSLGRFRGGTRIANGLCGCWGWIGSACDGNCTGWAAGMRGVCMDPNGDKRTRPTMCWKEGCGLMRSAAGRGSTSCRLAGAEVGMDSV